MEEPKTSQRHTPRDKRSTHMNLNEKLRAIIPSAVKGLLRPTYYGTVQRLSGIRPGSLTHAEIGKLLNKPDPVIFEVGCNDGSDTLEFLRQFPAARIYCFEPEPRAIRRFKQKLHRSMPQVTLFELALSDSDGWMDFHQSDGQNDALPEGWDYSGSICAPKNHITKHPSISFEKTTRVRTTTLDNICSDLGVSHIDFIWMDVQGAEGRVLRGGRGMLPHIDYIYTEYSNEELYEGQLGLEGLAAELINFDIVVRYPGDVLFRNRRSKEG